MNYQQTLEYLFSQLPMFQRIGAAAYKADLNNTIAICKLLGNPENKFRSIHVAGTNGKGSTSHMLASVLQAAGYKTGLYTSPHLKDFRERIRINGKMISRNYITQFVEKYKNEFEKIQPSFFEWTVALAFDYFRKQKVDVAVVETGLGGRLDSTNVITPLLSVITNISYDHMSLLGNTLELIAKEKAGIIKRNIPVVIGETHDETKKVFLEKAAAENAPVYFADQELKTTLVKKGKDSAFMYVEIKTKSKQLKEIAPLSFWKEGGSEIKLDLTGHYQLKNISTAIMSLALIHPFFPFNEKQLRKGISAVKQSTGLMGRWQTLSYNPLVIADTAHNEEGIKEVIKQIRKIRNKQLHFVLGMVNDKAIDKILNLLPKSASYYFCKANIPRALDAEQLAIQAAQYNLNGKVYSSVKRAFNVAKKKADKNDLVLICGSNFTVAEII